MNSFIAYLNESATDLTPIDETEDINLDLTDELLETSKIIAYSVGQTVPDEDKPGKDVPVNPKKFPTKAVDIKFEIQDSEIEIFFDPETKTWDSDIKYNGKHLKLSPEQFGQFFNSEFYNKLLNKFKKNWPLTDTFYGELYQGLCNKAMKVGPSDALNEDKPDKSMANKDVTGDGKRDFTASGRKIIKFSDTNVLTKRAVFYCWPNIKKLDRWSTWKDWRKIHPLCRMRFEYNGIPYGFTISVLKKSEDARRRGFRGYSLDPSLPPVQWLTKEENESVIRLSIVNKFIKHCIEKLTKYSTMSVDEILKLVNDPEKLTREEVESTQIHIHRTIAIIKNKQLDSFTW